MVLLNKTRMKIEYSSKGRKTLHWAMHRSGDITTDANICIYPLKSAQEREGSHAREMGSDS